MKEFEAASQDKLNFRKSICLFDGRYKLQRMNFWIIHWEVNHRTEFLPNWFGDLRFRNIRIPFNAAFMQFSMKINKFKNNWIKNWIVVVCLQSDSKVWVAQLKMKTNMNTKINIAPAFVAAVIASLYSYSHSCSLSFGCRYRSWLLWKSVEYLMHPAQLTGFFIFRPITGLGVFSTWGPILISLIQHNIVPRICLNLFSSWGFREVNGMPLYKRFLTSWKINDVGLLIQLSLAKMQRNRENGWTKFL